MSWVPIYYATTDKPEISAVADLLDTYEAGVLGLFTRLWLLADQLGDENGVLPFSAKALDRKLGHDGFVAAAVEAAPTWLEILDDGHVRVPNLDRYCGQMLRQTLLHRRRARESDARRAGSAQGKRTTGAGEAQNGCASPAQKRRGSAPKDGQTDGRKSVRPSGRTDSDGERASGVSWSESEGWVIPDSVRDRWVAQCPGVDVADQLEIAHAWLVDNPSKRPRKSYRTFFTKWLLKTKNRTHPHKAGSGDGAGRPKDAEEAEQMLLQDPQETELMLLDET